MRNDVTRASQAGGWTFIILALVTLGGGCSSEAPPAGVSPDVQLSEVIAHVQGGRLAAAYEAWLPASYRSDLDRTVQAVASLIDADDFAQVTGSLRSSGRQLAAMLSLSTEDDALVALAKAKLADLPATLGLTEFIRLKDLTARDAIAALDTTFFGELMQLDVVREKFGRIDVQLKKRERDWAQVLVVSHRGESPQEEVVELIRVDGKWLPSGWSLDWDRQVEGWHEAIGKAKELKETQPEVYRTHLGEVCKRLASPFELMQDFLPRIGDALGVAPSEAPVAEASGGEAVRKLPVWRPNRVATE